MILSLNPNPRVDLDATSRLLDALVDEPPVRTMGRRLSLPNPALINHYNLSHPPLQNTLTARRNKIES